MKRNLIPVFVICALSLAAESIFAETVEVVFDHGGAACSKDLVLDSTVVTADDGELIKITILNTQKTEFTYEIAGILKEKPSIKSNPEENEIPLGEVTLNLIHDKKYGGYTITLNTQKDSVTELPRAVFTLRVVTHSWKIGFGGGFTVSTLTSPAYGVEAVTKPDGTDGQIVRREKDRESQFSLGVTSLVHIWNTKHPLWAASFGLGLQSDTGASYYFGPTLRMGNKGALTAGAVFGSVDTLPSGTQEGGYLSDPNALNNLGSKIKTGFFLAFSYGFLGNEGDDLKKPFAPAGSMGGQ